MPRLAPDAARAVLGPVQRTEVEIASVEYDVWGCAACDARIVEPHARGAWQRCPDCAGRTVRRTTRTLVAPTTTREGTQEERDRCAHCAWQAVRTRPVPRLEPAATGAALGAAGSAGGWNGGSGGSSSGGSASFGGSGDSSGGGGGSDY
jgi:uncharacterized membrane protein YgcG